MLRVPKISKMDRTSILGDTIGYMKELLERIRQLQEEIDQQQETPAVLTIFRELNPNDMLARNTPKFEVERKEGGDTRVKIYCAAKPGLLLSTVSTVETLSLDMMGLTPDVVFLHSAGRQMWSAPSCMLAAVLISSPVSKWLDLPSFASIRSPVCSLCSSPLLPSPTQPLLPLTSSRQNRRRRWRQEENSESAATACKRGFV